MAKLAGQDPNAKKRFLWELETVLKKSPEVIKFFGTNSLLTSADAHEKIFRAKAHFEKNTPSRSRIALSLQNSPQLATYLIGAILADRVPCIVPAHARLLPSEFSPFPLTKDNPLEGLASCFHSASLGIPEDVAMIFYSSGTSGNPKSIQHTFSTLLFFRQVLADAFQLGENSVSLITLPMLHVSATLLQFWPALLSGARIGLLSSAERAGAFTGSILSSGVTHLTLTPYQLQILAREAVRSGTNSMPHVVHVSFVGDFLSIEQINLTKKMFPNACLHKGYGLTEAPRIAMLGSNDPDFFGSAAGRILPGIDIQIRNEAGQPAPSGENGEVWVRGPNVGILPRETFSLDEIGFFNTGDIGAISEKELLFIVGRKNDVFKHQDKWISVQKIEEKILRWKGITAACYLAKQPARNAKSVLFLETAHPMTAEELEASLTETLRRSELPSEVFLLKELPRLSSSKIDKFRLGKLLEESENNFILIGKNARFSFWVLAPERASADA